MRFSVFVTVSVSVLIGEIKGTIEGTSREHICYHAVFSLAAAHSTRVAKKLKTLAPNTQISMSCNYFTQRSKPFLPHLLISRQKSVLSFHLAMHVDPAILLISRHHNKVQASALGHEYAFLL
ncbi:hypothetical protein Nepgr_028630 [Nepenthes gracilis]|uniref:Uncharacterized protein n=1 Tax=Nepenthes gracilis TaxID=150966 RepID=A0AAD3Y2A6_NEPGR|nr:hypothetical protein Nepgr_028630 [Nepenthes gracilis]